MPGAARYGVEVGRAAGARLSVVEAGGPAARAGLAPADVICKVNGRALRDVIDWRWEADGATVEVEVTSDTGRRTLVLTRAPGESWGLDFTDILFDGVRTCRNACTFCFMAQLPPGLRPALYVRDDDYRLSFLQGNFVTLTNVDDGDVDRIVEQHLSPLYVSLHAVSPDVRASLVCAREDRALEVADELLAAGIELHVQIVLVPGVNDGDELERTLRWLAEREGVVSVGIVPLGYTRHQERFSASYESPEEAERVLAQIDPWQHAFRERDGVSWVHAADEFYLNAGRALPLSTDYDGFPQYENGIGLVRAFKNRFEDVVGKRGHIGARDAEPMRRPAVLTGTMFAPVLERLLARHELLDRCAVVAVPNAFFGGNVSVAGLLTASDVLRAIREHPGASCYLVPDVIFNADGLTLDGMTAAQLAASSGAEVAVVEADAEGLVSAIL